MKFSTWKIIASTKCKFHTYSIENECLNIYRKFYKSKLCAGERVDAQSFATDVEVLRKYNRTRKNKITTAIYAKFYVFAFNCEKGFPHWLAAAAAAAGAGNGVGGVSRDEGKVHHILF